MTANPITITWEYNGDGEVTASDADASLVKATPGVIQRAIAAMNPSVEQLQQHLNDWWDTPFRLTVTCRIEGGDARFSVEVEDRDDLRGPLVVLMYLLMEADESNTELTEARDE